MVELLAGRTALVTGASKNLGRAIAIGLGAAGANVAVTAQHAQAEVEATAEEIRGLGRQAIALTGDVGQPSDAEALVRAAVDELGPDRRAGQQRLSPPAARFPRHHAR